MGDANGGPGYGGYGGGYGYDGGYGGGYGYGGGRPGPWNQPPGQSGTPYDQQGSQNAQNLWSQYQGAQPGQGRDDLIRQMQGTDNGAAFNANMKNGGWVRTDSPGGNYSYSQPGGVSDQVRRMQEAQGLDNQGQPQWQPQWQQQPSGQQDWQRQMGQQLGQQWPTQQWSSQGNQGGGYGGYDPRAWRTAVVQGSNGGRGGGWGGGQGGWGGGQGGWGNGQGGWGNGQGGWGNGQGGGQPK